MAYDYYIIQIEEAGNPENIPTNLHSDFVKASRVFQMF
jgi:hypothetical protein